jgi:uncharacterized membrane protein SpoIIM required for sporulation
VDLDSYIQAHRQEWQRLEALVGGGAGRPAGAAVDETVGLYLRTSAHLAEVQTRYHDPSLERYLETVVSRARAAIYVDEPSSSRSVVGFFVRRYRAAFRRTLAHVVAISVLFAGVTSVIALWVATSAEARAGLLPAGARDAIERAGGSGGGAFDIAPPALSTMIFQNNVQVAFLAFALGITLGVGTIVVIVLNASLIGSLAGGFHAAGAGWAFWSLVLPHGFLELIAICIAGGAGLRIAWAIVEPGDRPRIQALGEEARDAVLVVMGVIPAFAIAATIEGFVTGRTGQPVIEVVIGAIVAAAYLVFLLVPDRSDAGPVPTTTLGRPSAS